MQLRLGSMWEIVLNVFRSICVFGFAASTAEQVNGISLPGKNKYVAGCSLESIYPAGFQMCQKLCRRRTDCCLINFNVDKLNCSLLSGPCSENDATVESKKEYIYDFADDYSIRTNNYQLSKCFSLSAGPEICLNYTTPHDCDDIQTVYAVTKKVATIYPYPEKGCPRYNVRCRMFKRRVWTLIQKRYDGSQDFFKGWEEYKHGFGNIRKEYWIGNQALFELTSTTRYELMIVLIDFEGNQFYARYSTFSVGNEASNFTLTVSGYSGDAGDSMTYHSGMQFSTYDRDNDAQSHIPCAPTHKAGWWYKTCVLANLNGIFHPVETNRGDGIVWYGLNNQNKYVALKSSTMMIGRY